MTRKTKKKNKPGVAKRKAAPRNQRTKRAPTRAENFVRVTLSPRRLLGILTGACVSWTSPPPNKSNSKLTPDLIHAMATA